jgi:hypothetical protein
MFHNHKSKKMETPKFLLVENPLTGKQVNIMPLFQYLQSEYYGKPTPLDVIEPIQDALDYLAVSLPSDGIDTEELKHRNYVNDRLITLRNTFSNMFKPL